jgi:hypothetical protein
MKLSSEQEWLEAMQEQDLEMPKMEGMSLFEKVFIGVILYVTVAFLINHI